MIKTKNGLVEVEGGNVDILADCACVIFAVVDALKTDIPKAQLRKILCGSVDDAMENNDRFKADFMLDLSDSLSKDENNLRQKIRAKMREVEDLLCELAK